MHTGRIVPSRSEALGLAAALARDPTDPALLAEAGEARDAGWGNIVTYSPKVFIPLTKLCRDVCHYCTFARPPLEGRRAYLTLDEVLEIARAGEAAGCREALFTLGDKPELRYRVAREELAAMGHETTVDYLAAAAGAVLTETGLLPHLNPGILSPEELERLREVAPSMGIMLETTSPRLAEPGQPHYGSPDKLPAVRLAMLEAAGRRRIPFTTGLLIGIGETWAERAETLVAIAESHARWGHVQEVIVQNFRAKPGTPMHDHPELPDAEVVATLVLARLILGPEMSVQCPPNLASSEEALRRYLAAGINDWGGVSPVTIDHVNPEAPWPEVDRLRAVTESAGFLLLPRLTVYPGYAFDPAWVAKAVRPKVLAAADGMGLVREAGWRAGGVAPPPLPAPGLVVPPVFWSGNGGVRMRPRFARVLDGARDGQELTEDEIVVLLTARGPESEALARAADDLRREISGDTVTFVVNRNINYTNMCYFRCGFCAFSKGPKSLNLRGDPYLLSLAEIASRTVEAAERGATEVCLQGGIHPEFTGDFYLNVVRAVKAAVPAMHVHAFSPLEVWQGAQTKGVSIRDLLWELKDLGLGSLPGTAAEILDDEVRAVLCPDKVNTAQWSEVARTAHGLGLPMTSTIMFGHVEGYRAWARHLGVLRAVQKESLHANGTGFTEFVPLPFVHMASPIYLKGKARQGPTFEEALKVHAVARLALHPWITNIQVSWVKMGGAGAQLALQAGCNDMGGTLMNENISRAAGASHGQELVPEEMKSLIGAIGRPWARRTTLYKVLETAEPVPA
ncbi:MAG TPA: 5-amino-6-(D-ribitylamino)uracil--L-tyrosine 4-hydroxyphenyl transferase CofH [Actinomycetota bacterium]|nr:5-amino-6-(D-ribitylamino)uracil--L-tyrosine 4-hydroxyphenyl transferase CofH [Actinomycetota bacterium]